MISLFVLFIDICSFALHERFPLKYINHGQNTKGWIENVEGVQNYVFRDFVVRLGLSPLITMSYRFISKNVVSIFAERWQLGTNTFHISYDGMTITLDDACSILGIPLMGKSVSADGLSVERAVSLVSSQLEVSPEDARNELLGAWGNSVRLEWLKDIFGRVSDVDPKPQIRNATGAFLLYILGFTLLTDKPDTQVLITYLRLLMDLDAIIYMVGVLLPWHKCIDSWDLLPRLASTR